ncbi:bifunctional diguanylate cyclase/phosphodiesterase [Chitinibacteraceae bacterium HSL-7]
MSLIRQLWLIVIAATLLAFSGSLVLSLYTARDYLQQQLLAQSNDAAAGLALSLTQQPKDQATIELMVSALFDQGHFANIRYIDRDGHVVIERSSKVRGSLVPGWFEARLPLAVPTGVAAVSDGWSQAGTITVRAHTRYAYEALWYGALRLLAVMAVGGLLIGLVLHALVRWVKRPLNAVVAQAQAIGERRFIQIAEPPVKELRTVVHTMNAMVQQVQTLLSDASQRAELLAREVNFDALTGLANRGHFMSRLAQALRPDSDEPVGTLVIIHIRDLQQLNQLQGRAATDSLIAMLAARLQAGASQNAALVARLNGADFALLMPDTTLAIAEGSTRRWISALANLPQWPQQPSSPAVVAALTDYTVGETAGDVLSRCDAALAQAANRPDAIASCARATVQDIPSQSGWQQLLQDGLTQRLFRLQAYPVLDASGQLMHEEQMLRLSNADGELLPAGAFMPMAERLGLLPLLDLRAIELALEVAARSGHGVAVNLSSRSIRDREFMSRLTKHLRSQREAGHRLWLEVNERVIDDHALAEFARHVRTFGCKVGIEHFGRDSGSIARLSGLPIDYIKIDGSFVRDIDQHTGAAELVRAIVNIARANGIMTIAEQVTNAAEWQTLKELGLDGLTGPATGPTP